MNPSHLYQSAQGSDYVGAIPQHPPMATDELIQRLQKSVDFANELGTRVGRVADSLFGPMPEPIAQGEKHAPASLGGSNISLLVERLHSALGDINAKLNRIA